MKISIILSIIALCCTVMVYSQTWEELNEKAIEYYKKGDYPIAIIYANKSRIKAENEVGKENNMYATSLNNLAVLYKNLGEYKKAEPLYIEALNVKKKVWGTHHNEYATSLNNLAMFYIDVGNYLKAETLLIEALNITENTVGPNHLYYATTINNLAMLYVNLGNYIKAEPYYIKASLIFKKVLGPEHPDYAAILSNLGFLYSNIGNYSKAESLYVEASSIWEKVLGPAHPTYATSLNNLAVLYTQMGDYTRVEKLYLEALRIRRKVLGPDHPDYNVSLGNLALFYSEMGSYVKAEPLYIEVLNKIKNVLGSNHPTYATSLDNLAVLYDKMGHYTKAEPLYIEALNIRKNGYGPDHPDYATSLNNLAVLYDKMGHYTKAEPLYIEALNIRKNGYGPDHPDYATSLNNLAVFYTKMGNYAKAEPLYIEALNIREKVIGPDHPDYAKSLENLALLYNEIGNYAKTEPLFVQANDNLNNQINNTFNFLSEKEKEQFLTKNINWSFEIYNSFFLRMKDKSPSITIIAYNNELAHKGMLLQSNTALRKAIYGSSNDTLISRYNQFINIHKKLSIYYTTSLTERKENIDSLENIADDLEKELIVKGKDLPGVENLTGLTNVRWQNVQQSLKPGEAAIEFVNFHYYDKKRTDSIFYCALVLRKDFQYPRMIYLFEEKQLREIISGPNATSNPSYINQLYSHSTHLNINLSKQNIIFNLVWEPVDSLLQGINTIYLAPSGLLHKVAFNAIPLECGIFLSDKYNLNILSSTRILAKENRAAISLSINDNVALFGGIEYDVDSTEMVTIARSYYKPDYDFITTQSNIIPEDNRGITWNYLPGTLKEVSDIQDIFKSKQFTTSLYSGKNATEESFKYLVDNKKSPEVIHFATHGFYFPEIKPDTQELGKSIFRIENFDKPTFTISGNPLFRSGILLAGASRIWNNLNPVPGIEDGILTAYEVSNSNLSNTKLVVLSACETGLGDIIGSEGVYGLQRAFKMAGVKNIVMSLWQVPDYQTSELMQLFYANCLNGMTIQHGFRTAQHTMRKKHDPFYWAAFVLIQ